MQITPLDDADMIPDSGITALFVWRAFGSFGGGDNAVPPRSISDRRLFARFRCRIFVRNAARGWTSV